MIERFQGGQGSRRLLEVLAGQKLLGAEKTLVSEVAERGELVEYPAGSVIIEQGDVTNDVFLLVAGTCNVVVNGRQVAVRGPGDHVGEMAAIQSAQPRAATVIANETVVVVKLSEEAFADIGGRHPFVYKAIAQELARRLLHRNTTIGAFREKVRVFIISSVEALPIARILENAFEHDAFSVELWNEGCFKVANYTLDDLEAAVDNSDFAIAIAHADDVTESRSENWPAPRDNVIFELGLFMGRLGRTRAILMEPREKDLKLPSDLAGVTTIAYQFEKGGENARLMGPACNKLREHIKRHGANNG
ncbi:nucleotide-binding protein [Phenylobacterium sp. LH3H17]|uniref:TIR domain-containing protein n=1 Tax=Phenylobacterium sp. LH3H17 TaxID=2903901 RepID=UPI0020C951AF|nr:TIR domain-containing protein [Phenylobacterium sp. LH3H17]UTP40926.1 nucleotide-binding protein [Phenylobacterium sp. LH3H17]